MTYILLDESGDLGFSFDKGSSRHFVVAAVITENIRPLEKIIRVIRSKLSKKYKVYDTLHAYRDERVTRQRLLRKLARTDCRIITVVVDKEKVTRSKILKKKDVYNEAAKSLIIRAIKHSIAIECGYKIMASRREMNSNLNRNFKKDVIDGLAASIRDKVTLAIATPSIEKTLQIADYVSWAVFQSIERGDDSYIDIIRPLFIGSAVSIHI